MSTPPLRMSPPPNPTNPLKQFLPKIRRFVLQLNPFYAIGAILITLYALYCALSPQRWHIIDGANFLFHEAGHAIFRPFGIFMHFLGGTLGQLFFPVVCTGYFAWKHQRFSACVTMIWLALNLFNISVYAGDAVATQLPIIEGTTHDWNWMLTRLGWLRHARLISWMIYLLGWFAFLVGTAGMYYYSQLPLLEKDEHHRWLQE
ncbi:MAG: hypothetical protein H6727_01035 [Myxococcales bacterium]|nr:hypothetical protein [Myxococcales bacterium]